MNFHSTGIKVRHSHLLFAFWLISVIFDILWLRLDQSAPGWDQGDHLTRALNYWYLWQQPHLNSSHWWTQLWLLSPGYRAPFIYLLTVPVFAILGQGFDQAVCVNIVFTAILIVTVYTLGNHLFTAETGLWAAMFCGLAPAFVELRLEYLLDYGVAVMTVLAFSSLTLWQLAIHNNWTLISWIWGMGFGVSLGLTLMTRPNSLLFLLVPVGFAFISACLQRKWLCLIQLMLALVVAGFLVQGWFLTNWITILSHLNQAKNWGVLYQMDHNKKGLLGWLYYIRILPEMLPWSLLIGGLGYWLWNTVKHIRSRSVSYQFKGHDRGWYSLFILTKWGWLWSFCLGAYVFHSWTANKEPRFILPCLPIIILMLTRGLTLSTILWSSKVKTIILIFASVLVVHKFFPLSISSLFQEGHFPYTGSPFPNREVVAEITKVQPYLRSNLGMVVNTKSINPQNMDFYGSLTGFRVNARQLALSIDSVYQDSRSLEWYLTKTGDQGEYKTIETAQQTLKQSVESNNQIRLHRTWVLPDGSNLSLHRRNPFITVSPLSKVSTQKGFPKNQNSVRLFKVKTQSKSPPGKPVSVTYELIGPWESLRHGLLLLTWELDGQSLPVTNSPSRDCHWFHDHGIGLGQLLSLPQNSQDNIQNQFLIKEQLAMNIPADTVPGSYSLRATYFNSKTKETYPLKTPEVQINVAMQFQPVNAPETDLLTQFRELAPALGKGDLELIDKTISRINQYDPVQDYLIQAEKTLTIRLMQQNPEDLDLTRSLVLSYVLQRKVNEAIKTVIRLTELEPQNPWAWAYLGFLRLYNIQPNLAQTALARAFSLNPTLPEVRILNGIAAILQFDFIKAWEFLS